MSGTYRDLKVWQTAMDMIRDTHRLTAAFPREETYALPSNSGGQVFPSQVTSLKAKAVLQTKSCFIF